MGSVLRSGYDVHLSALMIDIAYRLLPGRRKSSTTQAVSKRFTALEALFPEEEYGRNEADELRKLFDALDKGDWRKQSTEILHRISVQNIKRSVQRLPLFFSHPSRTTFFCLTARADLARPVRSAQSFSVHDFRSDGAHLLPAEPGKEGHHTDYESLTATDVISQKIFVPTPVWFGRDSLTVLIDEPPEMTQRRILEEKRTPDIRRPAGGQPAVDETRDARAVVHYSAIHKLYVRRLDAARGTFLRSSGSPRFLCKVDADTRSGPVRRRPSQQKMPTASPSCPTMRSRSTAVRTRRTRKPLITDWGSIRRLHRRRRRTTSLNCSWRRRAPTSACSGRCFKTACRYALSFSSRRSRLAEPLRMLTFITTPGAAIAALPTTGRRTLQFSGPRSASREGGQFRCTSAESCCKAECGRADLFHDGGGGGPWNEQELSSGTSSGRCSARGTSRTAQDKSGQRYRRHPTQSGY